MSDIYGIPREWKRVPTGCSSNVRHYANIRYGISPQGSLSIPRDRCSSGSSSGDGKQCIKRCVSCGSQPDGCSSATGYIPDRQGKSGFWTVEYYQPYFDIDTKTVRIPPALVFDLQFAHTMLDLRSSDDVIPPSYQPTRPFLPLTSLLLTFTVHSGH